MKINKFKGLSVLLLLVIAGVVGLLSPVSATTDGWINITVQLIDDGNYSTSIPITMTVGDAAVQGANISNVSFYAHSSGGEALVNVTNFVQEATYPNTSVWSFNLDVSSLTAGVSYNMTAVPAFPNGSIGTNTTVSFNPITIDNTKPDVDLDVAFGGESAVAWETIINYMCGTSDATDSILATQEFVVYHPSGDDTTTTTLTRQSSDFLQFTDTDYAGDYVFTCSANDSAGNKQQVNTTVTVDDLGYAVSVSGSGGSSGGNSVVWIIGLAIVLWLVFKKK